MDKEDLHYAEVFHYTVVRMGVGAVRTAVAHHMVVDIQVVRTAVDRILEAEENIPEDAVDRKPEMKVFRMHVDPGVGRGVDPGVGHNAGRGVGRCTVRDAVVDHILEMWDARNLEKSVDHIPARKASHPLEMHSFESGERADTPPVQQVSPSPHPIPPHTPPLQSPFFYRPSVPPCSAQTH